MLNFCSKKCGKVIKIQGIALKYLIENPPYSIYNINIRHIALRMSLATCKFVITLKISEIEGITCTLFTNMIK